MYFSDKKPRDWSFIGYYEYRFAQADFKIFQEEAGNLNAKLKELMEDADPEIKHYANLLFKDFRVYLYIYFLNVKLFYAICSPGSHVILASLSVAFVFNNFYLYI